VNAGSHGTRENMTRARLFSGLFLFPALLCAQEVVPAGAGSYASFPPAHEDDKRHGAKVAEMATRPIYRDASLAEEPVPTNQWWTNLLIDRYSGTLWAYPLAGAMFSGGVKVFLPTTWNDKGTDFETGPALEVLGDPGGDAGTADVVLADFESESYPPGWSAHGAFGEGPAKGKFPNQTPVDGYQGERLVNSFLPDDSGEGTLESAEFPLNRKYLNFLIAGGNQPTDLYIRLLVDGQEVRRSTGRNSEGLKWDSWDVSDFEGKTGRLEIADLARGGWGHISVDQITLSDHKPAADGGGSSAGFLAEDARALRWSDWMVQARLKSAAGTTMDATFVRGMPYIWIEFEGLQPVLKLPADAVVQTRDGTAAVLPGKAAELFISFGGRRLGFFLPEGTECQRSGVLLRLALPEAAKYLVVGAASEGIPLDVLERHARMVPRTTEYSWKADPAKGVVTTAWRIAGEALDGKRVPFLQGWIPHHYRHTVNDLQMVEKMEFATPRGPLRCAVGTEFLLTFPFDGLVPNPPLPAASQAAFDAGRMSYYLNAQAAKEDYGGDTYWGGKDIMRYGQNLAIAAELKDPAFEPLKARLRGALEDWFTYTPGETEHYFAYYDRWRGLVGFNDSYGSFQFTDNHFHYGYFTAAAAYLGMFDAEFAKKFRPMLEMVAKQYANWDRADKRFPRLRTFDVWAGHSYAGGFGSPGGNNQESSSEAMQSWGGLFLLGAVLGDDAMRDTGAMGWAVERTATMTYWFNYDAWKTGPAASVFPPAYKHAVVGILFNGGQAFATYFSGDPGWIFGIQWLPVSPFLEYLAFDPEFARWQDGQMLAARQAWLDKENPKRAAEAAAKNQEFKEETNSIESMGGALGNVILGYRALTDPAAALRESNALWQQNHEIAREVSQAGLVYYYATAYEAFGARVPGAHGSIPTSAVYLNKATGRKTYAAYNPGAAPQDVTFYDEGKPVGRLKVPAGATTSSVALTPLP
jgi:endoglucanase Acf2